MKIKLFTATKAFIIHNNKVLILRESNKYKDGANTGKYDVPGGRIIPGQRFDESLIREIEEETGLHVEIGSPFHVDEWRPIVRDEQWQVVGAFFRCTADNDKVTLSHDHDEYLWIDPNDYKNYHLNDSVKNAFISYLKK